MQSSCHGGQIQLNPSFVSRHIVPDGHGLVEQSSKPNFKKGFDFIYKDFDQYLLVEIVTF